MNITKINSSREMADVARLAAKIWREYYADIISSEQIDYMLDQFQSVAAISDHILNEGYMYYALVLENRNMVGYMAVKEDEGKLFLSKLYISKEHRGKGYASQAFLFLDTLCTSLHLSHIWLTVNKNNDLSIAVYKSKGFKIVREQVADIGHGYVMDDYIMEKEILK